MFRDMPLGSNWLLRGNLIASSSNYLYMSSTFLTELASKATSVALIINMNGSRDLLVSLWRALGATDADDICEVLYVCCCSCSSD